MKSHDTWMTKKLSPYVLEVPKNVADLQAFLGLEKCYEKFVFTYCVSVFVLKWGLQYTLSTIHLGKGMLHHLWREGLPLRMWTLIGQ
jgi:hypothetical protein